MLKIGHRGAPGYPRVGENTISSFYRALWKGADAIEFDVRRSRDGHIVVIHDASVDRTTNGNGLVKDLSAVQLENLDAGFRDFVPRLSRVLDYFGKRCLMHVEIKELGLAGDVLQLIRESGVWGRVIVSALDSDDNDEGSGSSWDELSIFSREQIPIALTATSRKIVQLGGHQGFIGEAQKRKAFAIHPQFLAVTPSMVQYAHGKGILVNTWTINIRDQVEAARRIRVDGVFSDCPEIL